MFGIGLPEMIVILALALIFVGPDKLPDFARSIAKGVLELKKTAEGLKESLNENGNPLDEIRPQLEETAKDIEEDLLEAATYSWKDGIPPKERHLLDPQENDNLVEVVAPQESEEPLEKPTQANDTEQTDKTEQENSPKTKIQNTVRDDLTSGHK